MVKGSEVLSSGLLGETDVVVTLRHQIAKVAASDSTVLIDGETGTGKELVAEEIHRASARRKGPFVVVDCGCIPRELLESELFGHEKGAFTGATRDRRGAFEEACGGTILLDELGELPLALQPTLLRAIENRTAKRVGASRPYQLDVRLLAATNRDLDAAASAGSFRSDLFFRIAVVRLKAPALRDRLEDIPHLARHFLGRFGHVDEIAPDFLSYLRNRDWPGNVRELRNVVERAVRLAEGTALHFTQPGSPGKSSHGTTSRLLASPSVRRDARVRPHREARLEAIERFSRAYATALYQDSGGNIARAAKLAEVDPSYVRRWFRTFELRPAPGDEE